MKDPTFDPENMTSMNDIMLFFEKQINDVAENMDEYEIKLTGIQLIVRGMMQTYSEMKRTDMKAAIKFVKIGYTWIKGIITATINTEK